MFHGDLRDGSLVRGAVKGQDVVLDLAGASGAAHSNRDPFRHLEDECGPHLGLFQACADSDPPPFLLFCSSRLVYGKPIQLPVDETHPLHPLSIYGVHKISLELYLKVFRAIRGLPFSVLRLSNAYGPNQPEETTHYGILNLFIQRAARGLPIQVYGDGRQKRDYVYVDDVITACLLLAMNPVCCGDTFNFGGREGIGVGDAARLVAALAGGTPVDSVPWPADTKSIETGDYQTDLARIDRLVGLPTQTRLRDGILATLEYYRGRD
jgi:nucleoside-diphosphate-sugar epimerase